MSDRAHPECWTEAGHVCQRPSGLACIEDGCDAPAGTQWGPYWCPEHDAKRLDRVSKNLEDILASFPSPPSENEL